MTVANIIAKNLLRIKHKTRSIHGFFSVVQEFPALVGCKHFHPRLILHIMDAISQKKFVNPMEVSFRTPQHALEKPDKVLRLMFDATKRFNATSTPLNDMM